MPKVFYFPGAEPDGQDAEQAPQAAPVPEERDPVTQPHHDDTWVDGRYRRTFVTYCYQREVRGQSLDWRDCIQVVPGDWRKGLRPLTREEATHVEYRTRRSKGRMPRERWEAWCRRATLQVDGLKVRLEGEAHNQRVRDAEHDTRLRITGFLERVDLNSDDALPAAPAYDNIIHPDDWPKIATTATAFDVMGCADAGDLALLVPAGIYHFRWGKAVVKPVVWTDRRGPGYPPRKRAIWCPVQYRVTLYAGNTRLFSEKMHRRLLVGEKVGGERSYIGDPVSWLSKWRTDDLLPSVVYALAALFEGLRLAAKLSDSAREAIAKPYGEQALQPVLVGAASASDDEPPPPETA